MIIRELELILYTLAASKSHGHHGSKKARGRSSTEVEHRFVAVTLAKVKWSVSIASELGLSLSTHLCENPVFHSWMKHIALDYHFVREQVQDGTLRVSHVSYADQLADALT